MNQSQFLIYISESGSTKLDVRLEDDTVWLSQKMMAELYQTTKQNINLHIQNIYEEGELSQEPTVKENLTVENRSKSNRTIRNFRIVQQEGKREVERDVAFYNLDMILSVGYRIKSKIATRFRQWATEKLKEYIIKAAEIIHERADSSQPNMGLTNWRGEKIRKQDVSVAKNYLNENELLALNNFVEQYLVFAEGQGLLLG